MKLRMSVVECNMMLLLIRLCEDCTKDDFPDIEILLSVFLS